MLAKADQTFLANTLSKDKQADYNCRMAARAYGAELVGDVIGIDTVESVGLVGGFYYGWRCIGWKPGIFYFVTILLPILLAAIGIYMGLIYLTEPFARNNVIPKSNWNGAYRCDDTLQACIDKSKEHECFVHEDGKTCVYLRIVQQNCRGQGKKRKCDSVPVKDAVKLDTESELDAYNANKQSVAKIGAGTVGLFGTLVLYLIFFSILNFYIKQRVIGFARAFGAQIVKGIF